MSRRTERVAASIERGLQELLARGLQDPRVKGLVTVTGVRVTDDLQSAFVSISVLPVEHESVTIHGLQAASGFIRRELGKTVEMRRLPTLEFQLDHSIKREAEVLAALEKVRRERQERSHEASPAEGAEP